MIYLQWILDDGNGRKKTENIIKRKKYETKEKIPSYYPVYEMEADCFPVSENTENKPDLP